MFFKSNDMPTAETAIKGRATPVEIPEAHFVNGNPLSAPWPANTQHIVVGMGCFWGAERRFWELGDGVFSTAVGYSAGFTENPTYKEVCTGQTGHNEVVLVVFDPATLPLSNILQTFWESHNPTQGMRQGNDQGTQYRSGIYTFSDEQQTAAERSKDVFQAALTARGGADITTEIQAAEPFYYAEAYHQQYLAKNPQGYCGLGGTGVPFPANT